MDHSPECRIRVEEERDWLRLLDIVDGFRDGVIANCLIDSGGRIRDDFMYVPGQEITVWLVVQAQQRENPVTLIRLNDVLFLNVDPSMDVEPAEATFNENIDLEYSYLRTSCKSMDVALLGDEWLGSVSLQKLEEKMVLFDL